MCTNSPPFRVNLLLPKLTYPPPELTHHWCCVLLKTKSPSFWVLQPGKQPHSLAGIYRSNFHYIWIEISFFHPSPPSLNWDFKRWPCIPKRCHQKSFGTIKEIKSMVGALLPFCSDPSAITSNPPLCRGFKMDLVAKQRL